MADADQELPLTALAISQSYLQLRQFRIRLDKLLRQLTDEMSRIQYCLCLSIHQRRDLVFGVVLEPKELVALEAGEGISIWTRKENC